VNDSKKENDVSGDFYLPVKKNSKFMIAGSGQSSLLKTLICKPFSTDEIFTQFVADRRNCECCTIF
jgi:hypothetical protein